MIPTHRPRQGGGAILLANIGAAKAAQGDLKGALEALTEGLVVHRCLDTVATLEGAQLLGRTGCVRHHLGSVGAKLLFYSSGRSGRARGREPGRPIFRSGMCLRGSQLVTHWLCIGLVRVGVACKVPCWCCTRMTLVQDRRGCTTATCLGPWAVARARGGFDSCAHAR